MKCASSEKVCETGGDRSDASNGDDGVRTGDGESDVNRAPSSAFKSWLTGYCDRLDQLVKNAGRR